MPLPGQVRNALLFALDKCRSITGPNVMDIRPTSLQIITRVWSEGFPGPPGVGTDTTLILPNWIKVRHVTHKEIAESGGTFEKGDVRVGRFTPAFVGPDGVAGGFTEPQLAPPVTDPGTQVVYILAQQSGATGINGEYSRVELQRDHTLHMVLILRRLMTTPGP